MLWVYEFIISFAWRLIFSESDTIEITSHHSIPNYLFSPFSHSIRSFYSTTSTRAFLVRGPLPIGYEFGADALRDSCRIKPLSAWNWTLWSRIELMIEYVEFVFRSSDRGWGVWIECTLPNKFRLHWVGETNYFFWPSIKKQKKKVSNTLFWGR